jgi:hypothetical protein
MLEFDRWVSLALSAALLASACGGDDDATSSTEPLRFVGDVNDTDARVAVLTGQGKLRIFFCGGADSVADSTHWFNVDISEGAIDIDAAPWKVTGSVKASGVTGQVTRDDGVLREFSASPVASGTLAGLYEGTADCGRLGLIVAQKSQGAAIEAQGACVGDGHAPEQVNPILPVAQDKGQIPVQTPGADMARSLLKPATLLPL